MSGSNEILLKNTLLFKYLSLDELSMLADIFSEEEYVAGEPIIQEGELGDSLFIIKSGTVQVIKDTESKPIKIVKLGAGELFGEMALIEDGPRSASIQCIEDTELLCITRRDFAGMFNDYPNISLKILLSLCRILCSRIRTTNETVVKLNKFISECEARHSTLVP